MMMMTIIMMLVVMITKTMMIETVSLKNYKQILTVCELVLKQMTIITMSMIAIVIKSTHESSLKPKLVTCPFAFHPPACI